MLVSQISFCVSSTHHVLWFPGKHHLSGLQPALRLLGQGKIKSFSLWPARQWGYGVTQFMSDLRLLVYSSNCPVFVHRWKETSCCITGFDQRVKLVSCEIHWSALKKGCLPNVIVCPPKTIKNIVSWSNHGKWLHSSILLLTAAYSKPVMKSVKSSAAVTLTTFSLPSISR